MESMIGYPAIEFDMQKAKSLSGAWQALEDLYMPNTREAKRRLELEFETIRMVKGEGPLDSLSRVGKETDKLAMLGDGKSEEEANHKIHLGHLLFKRTPLFPALISRVLIPMRSFEVPTPMARWKRT